jgi:hypothetical protein
VGTFNEDAPSLQVLVLEGREPLHAPKPPLFGIYHEVITQGLAGKFWREGPGEFSALARVGLQVVSTGQRWASSADA